MLLQKHLWGVIVAVGICVGSSEGCKTPPETVLGKSDQTRFVMFAVLEGLFRDGANTDLVKEILESPKPGHFVYKCPVCMPVKEAFEMYLVGQDGVFFYPYRPWGKGWPDGMESRLRSLDREVRLSAIKDLVARYVGARFKKLRFTAAERSQMKELLEDAKEFGNSVKKPDFGPSCANCLGAVSGSDSTVPK